MGHEIVTIGNIGWRNEIGKDLSSSIAEVARIPIERGSDSMDFVLAFGDITNAPVSSVVCPTGKNIDQIFIGGVSGAIKDKAGIEVFKRAQNMLERAQEIALARGITDEVILPFGASLAVPSTGVLQANGTDHVIFTNVYPKDDPKSPVTLSKCITSSLLEADRVHSRSIALPAIASGHFGGLDLDESIGGVLLGIRNYLAFRKLESDFSPLQEIYLVLFYDASWENYEAIKGYLTSAVQIAMEQKPKELEQSWLVDIAPYLSVILAAATLLSNSGAFTGHGSD